MNNDNLGTQDLRDEYEPSDFEKLERGKFYKHVVKNSNVVLLDDEVAEFFPNSESVNQALLSLIKVAKSSVKVPNQ